MTDHVTPRFRAGDIVAIEATVYSYYPGSDTVALIPNVGYSGKFYAKLHELPASPTREVFVVGDRVAPPSGGTPGRVAAIVGEYLIVTAPGADLPPAAIRQSEVMRVADDEALTDTLDQLAPPAPPADPVDAATADSAGR